MADDRLQPWPAGWPQHRQVCYGSWGDACDMLVGPCACGAWHTPGEFRLVGGVLYRDGESVQHLTRPHPRRTDRA